MANKKFSEFDLKTSASDVDFVVGYDGTDNVRISPSNLSSGGASDLNGLTDCLADTTNNFIGNVPASASGATQNTSLGIDALNPITSGDFNVGIGYAAGSAVTTGQKNTAIGRAALANVSTNSGSTAVGYQAGFISTAGDSVYVGNEPGRANSAAGHISIGYQAGYSQTSGANNTNIGYKANYSNTTGARNVTLGYEAGYSNVGSDGVLIGYRAGYTVASSLNRSTMVGSYAGEAVGSARFGNTFMGYESGRYYNSNINTFFGNGTGRGDSSGSAGSLNTAIGGNCFQNSTTASKFVAIGYQCLANGANTGDDIIAIGANIHTSDTLTGSNNIVIGGSSSLSSTSVSNEITLGNSSITALRCAVTSITSISDERDKSEIKDLQYGLDFIDSLQPREFVWDNRAEIDKDGEEFYSANKGKKDFGFIAQEVQALDNDTLRLVYDENPEKLELSYGKLVPVLVKAIQELKAEVELLKS